MSNISDTNGRGFEYILVETIKNELYKNTVEFTSDTIINQVRDSGKFNSLDDATKEYFNTQSFKIVEWLHTHYYPGGQKIIVDRLNDGVGGNGNPTDIVLTANKTDLNISLKHNNISLKHQRPASVFTQIGLQGHKDEKPYRSEIKRFSNDFYDQAKNLGQEITLFNEVKSLNSTVIDTDLYHPVMVEYSGIINRFGSDKSCVSKFFFFLVGNVNYLQITMSKQKVEIKEYNNIPSPNSMQSVKINNSNYIVKFDNGFEFNLRIHTASSRLESCSKSCCELKIDTTNVKSNIPSIEI